MDRASGRGLGSGIANSLGAQMKVGNQAIDVTIQPGRAFAERGLPDAALLGHSRLIHLADH